MERKHVLALIAYSTALGMLVGLFAAAFTWVLYLAQNEFMGRIAGFLPPGYSGENGILHTFRSPHPLFYLLTLPLLFATASLFGHNRGLAKIIASFHQQSSGTLGEKMRYSFGSLIELGAGSPLGREGPMAVLGNWIGEALGRSYLKNDAARHLPFAGMAAGFASAFHAPVAGALLAVEIFHPGLVLEIGSLGPALVGGLAGFMVYGAFWGYQPLLSLHALPPQFAHLGFGLISGAAMAFVGSLWMLAARSVRRLSFGLSFVPRHALLGLLIGLVAIFLPQVLGDGLSWLELSATPILPTRFIALLALAKLAVLALALGLGGYGAVISPSLAIGGLFSILLARLAPAISPDAAAAALVGMGALLAGVARTPFAAILIISEMGGYTILPLAIPAIFTSYLLTINHAFPEQSLGEGTHSGAHYSGLKVSEPPFEVGGIERAGETGKPDPSARAQSGDAIHVARKGGNPVE